MVVIRRFFDTAPANESGNAGGENTETTTTAEIKTTEPAANASPSLPAPAFTLEELKSFGFDSKEQFVAHLQKVKEESKPDEEKKKQANIDKATFLKFAAEENLITDNFNKYESLSAKADRDLVFEKYQAEWKDENPDIKDEGEIAAQSKAEFEAEYKLDSQSEKAKTKGLAKLAKEAKDLRSPAENDYNTAKSKYEDFKKVNSESKVFDSLVEDILKEVPEKLSLKLKDGETDIEFDVDLTKEQKAEINKTFKNNKVFSDWYTSTTEERSAFKGKLSKKIEGFIKINTFDGAVQEALNKGIKLGTAKGSNVGATNTFGIVQKTGVKQEDVVSLDESNKKVAEARQKAKSNR